MTLFVPCASCALEVKELGGPGPAVFYTTTVFIAAETSTYAFACFWPPTPLTALVSSPFSLFEYI